MGGLLGGKGYVAPSQIIGGPALCPPPPSYAYVLKESRTALEIALMDTKNSKSYVTITCSCAHSVFITCHEYVLYKSRKETPQKLTQLSSRSHPRHHVGKRTAQKDITIDTTSDSQVNSNFPNRWSPASLTFNNYFYLFLY